MSTSVSDGTVSIKMSAGLFAEMSSVRMNRRRQVPVADGHLRAASHESYRLTSTTSTACLVGMPADLVLRFSN